MWNYTRPSLKKKVTKTTNNMKINKKEKTHKKLYINKQLNVIVRLNVRLEIDQYMRS